VCVLSGGFLRQYMQLDMVLYFISITNICGGLEHLGHIVGHFCLPPCHMDLGWITKLPTADVFHRGCFVSVFVMSVSLYLQWEDHCSFINFFMMHMLKLHSTRRRLSLPANWT